MAKRISSFFILFLLLISGLYAGGQTEVIKVGLSMPQDSASAKSVNGMYELFKQEVETNSNGALQVDIVYGGALGKPDERLSQMKKGLIQMTDAADGNYASIYRDVQVLNMPFLFPTEQIAWQVMDGPIGDKLAEGIRQTNGIRVLGWWESGGFKHYSANKPILKPEDMKGLKMRVLGPIFSIPVKALGGSPAPIAFNELYTALKTGVVDGQDNAVWVFNAVQLYEVQKYLMLDGHIYAFGPIGINDEFFSKLSAEHQKIIVEAAKKAVAFNREYSRRQEADEIAFAKSKGVEVIPFTAEQKKAFAAAVQPEAIAWLKENMDTPSLIDEVLKEVDRLTTK